MTNVTYAIGAGGDFPKTVPTSSATIAVNATSKGGRVSCQYRLAYTAAGPGQPPTGVSVKNELFVTFANGQKTQVATVSVKPFRPQSTPKSSPSGSPSRSPSGSPSPLPSGSPTPNTTPAPTSTGVAPTAAHLATTGSSPLLWIFFGLVIVVVGCLVGSGRVFVRGR